MDFVLLQDLGTVRNGGFATDKAKMKGKVCPSARSSSSSSPSLRIRRRLIAAAASAPSSMETPSYTSPRKPIHASGDWYYNQVMKNLCKEGRIADAEKLLSDMAEMEGCSPSAATFRILLRVLCVHGLIHKAIALVECMLPQYGVPPEPSHYVLIVHCLCKMKKMGMAVEYIEVMISRGFYPNIAVFNTLCGALWIDDKVDAALGLFNLLKDSRICAPNSASYGIVIQGLARCRRSDQAMQLLREFRSLEGFEPDMFTYVRLCSGLIKDGRAADAIELLDEMEALDVDVPYHIYSTFTKGLCSLGETDRAIDLLVYMISKGCSPSQSSYAAVIEGLTRDGLGRVARELLNELFLRGVMSYGWTNGVAARMKRTYGLE
ncbi:Pentatricopeptide repeat-containing protein At1g09900 [Linum grandiflorum]